MDELLVVTFREKESANEAVTALHELNGKGVVRLDRLAVIAKDAAGQLSMENAEDDFPPPSRTLAGTALGSLLGLLGGPPGAAVGAGLGGLVGLIGDLRTSHIDRNFLTDVAAALVPGTYAVVAEGHEESEHPVDDRMQAIGGTVFRTPRN
jgi:uncharacterized membrane protein